MPSVRHESPPDAKTRAPYCAPSLVVLGAAHVVTSAVGRRSNADGGMGMATRRSQA